MFIKWLVEGDSPKSSCSTANITLVRGRYPKFIVPPASALMLIYLDPNICGMAFIPLLTMGLLYVTYKSSSEYPFFMVLP